MLLVVAMYLSNPMLALQGDGSLRLTSQGAGQLASLPLRCLEQQYPNKTGHTAESASDAVQTPRELHPAFYGCFDWHSSVHGHWMLVRLLKSFPDLARRDEIRRTLAATLTAGNIQGEVNYFVRFPLARTFERTYGWAWLLKLDEELAQWDDPQGRQWRAALKPLTRKVVELWTAFLPKQTYPNRTGVHPNTAFGLVFALDWVRTTCSLESAGIDCRAFETLIVARARDYYLTGTALAAVQEPDGSDFLSPSLEAADLMRRVLPRDQFASWFARYFTPDALANLSKPPVVSDRTDLQIVHLDGLSFSRGWCLKGIASILPDRHPRRPALLQAARELISSALPHVANGEYGGEHWLASFAVYALSG